MIKSVDECFTSTQWDNLISTYDNSNFYQSYSNFLIRNYKDNKSKLYIYYDKNQIPKIAAMVVDEFDVISIPFGPVFDKDISEEEIIDFLSYIKNQYKLSLEFSIDSEYKNINFIKELDEVWNFSTILLELNNIENLRKGFNENRRRIVKKCLTNLKDAIISEDPSNAQRFYKIYCERLEQTGGIVDFSFDELEHMLKTPNVKLHLCQNGSDDLGGIITFRFNDTLINRYNCTNPKFLSLNPNSYLDYTLIKNATIDPNLKFYDFSGFVEGDNLDQKTMNLNRYKTSYGPKKIKSYNWYKL